MTTYAAELRDAAAALLALAPVEVSDGAIPSGEWLVDGNTVRWGEVASATRYKIAYRQSTSGGPAGYVSDPLSAPRDSYTFTAHPGGMTSPFQVGWAWYDGVDHWAGGWQPISLEGVVPPPAPPPSGGTTIFTRPPRTVNFSSGSNTGFNNFWPVPTDVAPHSNTSGVWDMECEYDVSFPSSFRWSNGGFKTPGPGGASSGPVPNGCDQNPNGWSARLQADGAGSGGLPTNQMRVAAYPYLQTTPPSRPGLGVQNTGCGIIIRPTGSGVGVVTAGQTANIRQRIQLNSPGVSNGRIRIWLDGVLIIDHDALRFSDTCRFLTHMIEVWYFGGTNTSPQSQSLSAGSITLRRMG